MFFRSDQKTTTIQIFNQFQKFQLLNGDNQSFTTDHEINISVLAQESICLQTVRRRRLSESQVLIAENFFEYSWSKGLCFFFIEKMFFGLIDRNRVQK